MVDEEEYEEIAGKCLRLDVIGCEMILVGVLFFLAVLGDGNESGIKVPGVANTAKEEGVASTVIGGEFRGVELGLCRVMAKIVVFGGFGAPATDQLQKQLPYHQTPLKSKGILTNLADTSAFPASSPKSPPQALTHDKTQRLLPPFPIPWHPS